MSFPAGQNTSPEHQIGSRAGERRILLRSIGRYIPGAVGPAAIGVVSTAAFTRIFDASEYGFYALAMAGVSLLSVVGCQWLAQSVNRYLPGKVDSVERTHLKRAASLAILITAGASAAVLGIVLLLAGAIFRPAWFNLLVASSILVLVTMVYQPLLVVLQAQMRAGRHSMYNLANSAGRLAIALMLVLLVLRDPASLVWASALTGALLVAILWRDATMPMVVQAWRDRRHLFPEIRKFARYGIPMTGWVLASTLLVFGDRYVLQLLRGSAEVGIYSANYHLVMKGAGLVAAPILLAAHPFLMKAWDRTDRSETAYWLGAIANWFLTMGACLVAFMLLFAPDIARVLLGADFREGYAVMTVVMGGIVAWHLGMYVHKPHEFSGRTGYMLLVCAMISMLNVVLNLVLIPPLGYMGAAYATLMSYVAYTATMWIHGRRFLTWRLNTRSVACQLLILTAGVALIFRLREMLAIMGGYMAGLITAGALMAILALVVLRPALQTLFSPYGDG